MIEFRGINKSFAGVPVLREVSFRVEAGQTFGLVGENGAGKSTLMNILGGNLEVDSGEMLLSGRSYTPAGPADASRAGIAFIHQELNLFPNLSIAENIFLTSFPRRLGLLRKAEANRRTAALLKEVGLAHEPRTKVERLSAGERQLVEIAKALAIDARLIILDEPTTSLSAPEAERLFALLGRLREKGVSMIYISHALADVLRLCDSLVVLRDGQVVGAGSEFNIASLVTLMVGRSLNQLYPARKDRARSGDDPSQAATGQGSGNQGALGEGLPTDLYGEDPPSLKLRSAGRGQVLMEVNGLTNPGIIRDISFRLHRGEVLGLSGLMGAGRSELARILFGLDPCARGEVVVSGRPVHGGVRRRIRSGMAFLTENRREDGLCLEASIAENIALVALRRFSHAGLRLIRGAELQSMVTRIRSAVRLTPSARDEQAVKTLSGGNQQKVVLGKWLLAEPSVLILDEPTRGIDVGAKFEIYQLIFELAAKGSGVLVLSSELEELIGICDRILVMRRGEIVDELPKAEFDRERILRAALHT